MFVNKTKKFFRSKNLFIYFCGFETMNKLGTCQICERADVPLRSASSHALGKTTFIEIIVSLIFTKLKF